MLQNAAQMDACAAQKYFQICRPETVHVKMQKGSEVPQRIGQPCGPLPRPREREKVALLLIWSDNSGSVRGAVGACLPKDSTQFQCGK
jgi:hypothetical protein